MALEMECASSKHTAREWLEKQLKDCKQRDLMNKPKESISVDNLDGEQLRVLRYAPTLYRIFAQNRIPESKRKWADVDYLKGFIQQCQHRATDQGSPESMRQSAALYLKLIPPERGRWMQSVMEEVSRIETEAAKESDGEVGSRGDDEEGQVERDVGGKGGGRYKAHRLPYAVPEEDEEGV